MPSVWRGDLACITKLLQYALTAFTELANQQVIHTFFSKHKSPTQPHANSNGNQCPTSTSRRTTAYTSKAAHVFKRCSTSVAHLCIQLHHWRPLPSGPPANIWNTGSMRPMAPPSLPRTMPVRMMTTRVWARLAAASHSRQTCRIHCRKSCRQ